MLKQILFLGLILSTASAMHAQATATASRQGDAQVGIGFTSIQPDYGTHRIDGIAAYGDFDFTSHLGLEGEFHYAKEGGSDPASAPIYEKTYEIGGRYFRTYGRLKPYAKGLYGRGVFNFPYAPEVQSNGSTTYTPTANLAYNIFALGGGADFAINRFLNVRADYEYQHWFGFVNSSLSPTLITVGVAYHFR